MSMSDNIITSSQGTRKFFNLLSVVAPVCAREDDRQRIRILRRLSQKI